MWASGSGARVTPVWPEGKACVEPAAGMGVALSGEQRGFLLMHNGTPGRQDMCVRVVRLGSSVLAGDGAAWVQRTGARGECPRLH